MTSNFTIALKSTPEHNRIKNNKQKNNKKIDTNTKELLSSFRIQKEKRNKRMEQREKKQKGRT